MKVFIENKLLDIGAWCLLTQKPLKIRDFTTFVCFFKDYFFILTNK
jgi:hypothetical protein